MADLAQALGTRLTPSVAAELLCGSVRAAVLEIRLGKRRPSRQQSRAMQLTKETVRLRWAGLIVAWAIVASALCLHADGFARYIGFMDTLGLRGAATAPTPFKRICPTMYADTQMWVRHAVALSEGAGPQLRYTHVDNAPEGREVHWSSGFAWLLVGVGKARQAFTGEPLSLAIEHSLAWFNVPFFLVFIALLSAWTARRAGLGAGVIVAVAMAGNPSFYTGFFPNYVDHHGLLAVSTFGLFLGGVFMGAGLLREKAEGTQLLPSSLGAVRTGAVFSAVCGAVGMWVSAATTVPAIAIMGVAGAVTIALYGRKGAGLEIAVRPDAWRLWGRCGAGLSLAFYLLEYAPTHLGLRLEVNHPLYALGWWAGSEFVAAFADWRTQGLPALRPYRGRLIAAGVAIVLLPAVIAIAGERVFVVFDPFISRLTRYVAEGISIPRSSALFGWGRVFWEMIWMGCALLIGLLGLWRSRRQDRPLIVFCLVSFLAFAAMGFAQVRWLPSASGPEICVIFVGLSILAVGRPVWLRWAVIACLAVALCSPPLYSRIKNQYQANSRLQIDRMDAIQPIFRDIAAVLRADRPNGEIVLLTNPNASTAIGYYGGFQTVGTLYWENLAGTKAAAAMFSAQTETEARRLIRARGVTHVAMVSTENFLPEYLNLLHPPPQESITLTKSFGYQLLVDQQIPIWLEVIPYLMPADVPGKPDRVILLKTKFGDPRAEDLYESALIDIDAGRIVEGEVKVDAALAIEPRSATFLLIKSRLLLTRRQVGEALSVAMAAVDNAEPGRRFSLCASEGSRFYRSGAHAAAILLFRRALEVQYDVNTDNNIAWLLATSADATVRNGAEALKIAERIISDRRETQFLATYGAALAEVGRFAEAITVTTQALVQAREANEADLVAACERRIKAYQQGGVIHE